MTQNTKLQWQVKKVKKHCVDALVKQHDLVTRDMSIKIWRMPSIDNDTYVIFGASSLTGFENLWLIPRPLFIPTDYSINPTVTVAFVNVESIYTPPSSSTCYAVGIIQKLKRLYASLYSTVRTQCVYNNRFSTHNRPTNLQFANVAEPLWRRHRKECTKFNTHAYLT